jgi:hypothetical protein
MSDLDLLVGHSFAITGLAFAGYVVGRLHQMRVSQQRTRLELEALWARLAAKREE